MLVEGFPLWFFETHCWVVAPGEDGPSTTIGRELAVNPLLAEARSA